MVQDQGPQGWLSGVTPPSGDATDRPRRGTSRRRLAGVGLVAAGVVAGGVLAGTLGAAAATSGSTTATYAATGAEGGGRPANSHSSTPVRSDEKAVSDAALAAQLKQKALAAVPGGTVYRIETDADGATYEAHMTKADGAEVTVKFDKNLNVTGTESGMGKGGPSGGPRGGPAWRPCWRPWWRAW